MKRVVEIILVVIVAFLIYYIAMLIYTPLQFEKELTERSKTVVEKLKDIRSAERFYKGKYGKFTDNFDTLINFVLYDSVKMERKLVDEDDSVAMAQLKKAGKKNIEEYYESAFDVVFAPKKLTEQEVRDLRYIPYNTEQKEFHLAAGEAVTGSTMVLPTVECYALYPDFLNYVEYKQEVINLIDLATEEKKIPIGVDKDGKTVYSAGLQFGSLESNNNENGNWGE